ncbi:glycoside hydrolase family 3 protein [Sediminitomix flava]|uniref:beta-N-acetylhexosaminidase n=1 Tax=Sediminitomix flava TaxID=379075 RepID=A0A315ZWW1_SEDFL|nr:glycoside hydrolase family 3 N-terminal domain-containing protein [Sediminitomix flava]PWJ41817.1 beta-glucosidase-like glycosyl hydrolase [Sediminitomix flava]
MICLKRISSVIVLSFIHFFANAQSEPDFLKYYDHPWVDSVFHSLSLDEQIAQLIFIPAPSINHQPQVEKLIKKYNVGGVVFFKSEANEVAKQINAYNEVAKVPVAYAIDGEWGIGMRIKDGISFPYAMTIGAIQDEGLIFQMGETIGRHCKRLGIHVNFAPVVDVNNNPKNPVISYRSFGDTPSLVANRATSYFKGMESENVLSVAKHFPGHGNTQTDSHHTLPILKQSKEEMLQTEVYPFIKMIDNGIGGVMSGHLEVPSLDPTANTPASLSKPILEDFLQNELTFEGLIFTDGIRMKGITAHHSEERAHALALAAGNDVVEFSFKVPQSIREIRKAIDKGELSKEDIEYKCRKVLAFKFWSDAYLKENVELKNLEKELNKEEDLLLKEKLAEAAITVLKDDKQQLPLLNLDQRKVAVLSIGRRSRTSFQRAMNENTNVDLYNIDLNCSEKERSYILKKLQNYDLVLASIHRLNMSPTRKSIVVDVVDNIPQKVYTRAFGVTSGMEALVNSLAKKKNTILCFFGNPYALNEFQNLKDLPTLVMGYQDSRQMHEAAVRVLLGKIDAKGELPVSINEDFKTGGGLKLKAL